MLELESSKPVLDFGGKKYKDMAGKDSKDMAGKDSKDMAGKTKDMAGKDTNEMAGKDPKIWREKTPKYGGNHFQIYPHHPPIDHTIQHQRSTQHCRCRRPPNKYHPTIFHLEVVVLIAHSLLLPISSARFIDPVRGWVSLHLYLLCRDSLLSWAK